MFRKLPLDAAVSHIHDALCQEGDDILIPRDVLSTILDAVTQSAHTERALAQVEADYLSVRCKLETYRRVDDLVAEELCRTRQEITAFVGNKLSEVSVTTPVLLDHIYN